MPLGISHCGAGADLSLARRPAFAEIGGRRIALLSYNCVGPETAWATSQTAGCAWLPIRAAGGAEVSPQADLQTVAPEAFEILQADIAAARTQAGIVLVAMHKGIVHVPARLAPYEREIARGAIDAGADAIIGHHAHIVRGIEFYRGRPIFHGLGNGCVVTRALSPDQDHPARREWAERRKQMFGFEPDPAYPLAPFHPEALNAFLGRLVVAPDGAIQAGIVPVFVEPPGRPVLAQGEQADRIARYLEQVSVAGGLAPITVDCDGRVAEAA